VKILSSLLLASVVIVPTSCRFFTGAYACSSDENCPATDRCVEGSCVADGGEGEEGEGDLVVGEGEGDLVGEGEGDVVAGEGEGDVVVGEGEGDVVVGEGEGDIVVAGEGEGEGDVVVAGEGEGEGEPPCVRVPGNVRADTNGQFAALVQDRACVEFTTRLTIGGNVSVLTGASVIRTVEGDLNIESTALTSTEGLSGLERVTGNLNIRNASNLDRIRFAALTRVGGLTLSSISGEPSVNFAVLDAIDNNLVVENTGLEFFTANALTRVGGRILFTNNSRLRSVNLDSLRTVGDDIGVTNHPELCSEVFPAIVDALDTFGGSFTQANSNGNCGP